MGEQEDRVFYGVYIPSGDEGECIVVSGKSELNEVLKSNKKARFKQFATEKEAREFTLKVSKTAEGPSTTSLPLSESSPFKSLSPQEMVELRKAIERQDIDTVKAKVNENPRYLVSSGDTPSILQVGSRYNALHVAARYNCPEACSFILDCISSKIFMRRLYSGSKSDLHERCNFLLDLYLNTPDKGVNETPLHFASKYGALAIVKILVSYDQCDKERLNKYGKTAKDIVCSRPLTSSAGSIEKLREAIIKALDQQFYVGVIRSPDACVPPTVAEPFTLHNKEAVEQIKDSLESPNRVSGMAGPMTLEEAVVFRKKWKTPPRKLNFGPSLVRTSIFDPEKGMEKIGRALASENQVPWKEYWPFLDAFADLTSEEGLALLEKYLDSKVKEKISRNVTFDSSFTRLETTNSLGDDHSCTSSLTNAGGCFSDECENDDFFYDAVGDETFSDSMYLPLTHSAGPDKALSPISALCQDFTSVLKISAGLPQFLDDSSTKTDPFFIPLFSLNSICTVWATKIATALPNGAGAILRQVTNFQNYLASCAGDRRFKNSPFSKAHSILGQSIREKLELGNSIARRTVQDIEQRPIDESVRNAALCILKFIDSDCCKIEACDCRLVPKTSHHTRNRRLNYDSDDDSDLEFFTPPSSPPDEPSPDSATLEAYPPVYIVGDRPTKVDLAVLDALGLTEINPSTHPRVHAWKTLCQECRPVTATENWSTPDRDRELLESMFAKDVGKPETPSWHRNLFGLDGGKPTNS